MSTTILLLLILFFITPTTSFTTPKPKPTIDVGIIGSGPAGLILANTLLERNYSIRIFEKRPSFSPIGAAVFLYPFALNSLRDTSPKLEQSLRDACTVIDRITYRIATSQGNTKEIFSVGGISDSERVFGSPFVVVKFWDMLQALRMGLDDEYFRFGHDLERYEQLEDGGIKMYFGVDDAGSEGRRTESYTARYMIDAGGVRSVGRKQLTGDEPMESHRATFAVAPSDRVEKEVGGGGGSGDDLYQKGEFVFSFGDTCGATHATFDDGDVWFTQASFNQENRMTKGSKDVNELKKDLSKRYEGWPEDVKLLVRCSENILETTVSELPVSLKWGSGDMTLVGDSAHAQIPSLGLGLSTAFGDIKELTRELDEGEEGGLDRGVLRRYESKRVVIGSFLQLLSRFANFVQELTSGN